MSMLSTTYPTTGAFVRSFMRACVRRLVVPAGANEMSDRMTDDSIAADVAGATSSLDVAVQCLAQTGEGLRDGEIVEWFVRPGDTVQQYDPLCRVQSDKATIDVTSAYGGTVRSLSGGVGDVIAVGEPLCTFSVGRGAAHGEGRIGAEDAGDPQDPKGLEVLVGDGDHKRMEFVVEPEAPWEHGTRVTERGPFELPQGHHLTKRKLTSYRRSMMHAMQAAAAIPQCHALDVISGVPKISTPFAVKALAHAVARVPIVHAILDPEDESYTVPDGVHVSVAIRTPSGLAVPCLRHAQRKSVEDIRAEIVRLRRLAIECRLSRDDVEGGNITLSNIGSVGLVSGIGVVQPNQTALVTVGRAEGGSVHVSVSADHRLVDGSILAEFLAAFRRALRRDIL